MQIGRQKIRHDEYITKIIFEDNIDNKIDPDRSYLSSDEDDKDPSCKPPSQKVKTQFTVELSGWKCKITTYNQTSQTRRYSKLAKQNSLLPSF
ncbi:hypothetical protein QYM36_016001 [Artemia franciscana]|uniref:Uncharacterized protein n=1 Tax=Artemia franciscana TaxID=6661 RepID=A0AA88HBM4_ARTSF|nr:hypothetical protein QYM36_016001 [Artemia franciscana]